MVEDVDRVCNGLERGWRATPDIETRHRDSGAPKAGATGKMMSEANNEELEGNNLQSLQIITVSTLAFQWSFNRSFTLQLRSLTLRSLVIHSWSTTHSLSSHSLLSQYLNEWRVTR